MPASRPPASRPPRPSHSLSATASRAEHVLAWRVESGGRRGGLLGRPGPASAGAPWPRAAALVAAPTTTTYTCRARRAAPPSAQPPPPPPPPPPLLPAGSRRRSRGRHSSPVLAAAPDAPSSPPPSPPPSHARAVLALAAATALAGAANRVLYKAALDAAGGSSAALYLAALQGAGPALVYRAILAVRESRGAAPAGAAAASLLGSRWRLASVGAGEAASSAISFAAAARLPGALLPLLQNAMLVWQLAFERVVLRRAQPGRRYAGAVCVMAGVCLAAWPSKGGLGAGAGVPLDAVAAFAGAMAFPAVAFLTKEAIFADAAAATGGVPLDVFALAARTSAVQACCVLALLPLSKLATGVAVRELWATLAAGAAAVVGPAAPNKGLLPLSYVAVNILFNVFLISLVRTGGALAAGVAAAVVVPLAACAFAVPWPGLPPPARLGPLFGAGVVVSVAGLALVLATPPPKAATGGKGGGVGGDAPLVLGEEGGP